MSTSPSVPIRHADRFFIGGQWVAPSSDATIKVIDPGTEELYFSVAEAQAADIARAVGAAREAFDNGPWPRLTHEQRAGYLRALAAEVREDRRRRRPDVAARVRRDLPGGRVRRGRGRRAQLRLSTPTWPPPSRAKSRRGPRGASSACSSASRSA